MYYLIDSDGNTLGGSKDGAHPHLDDALAAAFKLVLSTWADWDTCTIVWSETDTSCRVATVERDGQRGTRRVRVALAGAGWINVSIEVAS